MQGEVIRAGDLLTLHIDDIDRNNIYYFMLFGSLSENNSGLSLDNLTVSSSEIIVCRANRQFSDISGNSIVRYLSIR